MTYENEATMLHHVSVGTNDLNRSKRFYDAVLPIVDILPLAEAEDGVGYSCDTVHFSMQAPIDGKPASVGNGSHVAFGAKNRGMVYRFYAVALENGCR